ncbi:hypothetical protein Trco_002621 [Trichoderma cornu-damae]|uniref:Uncharacterized protein n=1 Tax=Trichoderma cornu-damae TaxID=654480 RepID=A0A9P8QN07_9HYPO|nr:hypothetical protein Trco_002621 [Trichoderma cornu-damae]
MALNIIVLLAATIVPLFSLWPEALIAAGARRWLDRKGLAASRHQAPHVQNFQASFLTVSPQPRQKLCPRSKVIPKRVGHRVWRLEARRNVPYDTTICDLRVHTTSELVATGEACREVLLGLLARTGDRESAIS